MFKFSQLIATKKQAEQQTTATRFRALMTRAALRDDLKPEEAAELAALNDQTGFHLDLAALATDLCQHKQFQLVAAGLAKAEQALAGCKMVVSDYDRADAEIEAAHAKLLKEREQGRAKLTRDEGALKADRDRAEKGRLAADAIECTHWQFYDKPSPQVASAAAAAAAQTKRDTAYLVYGLASLYQTSFGQTRVIEVEGVWENPAAYPDFDKLIFVPYEKQTQAELDALIVLARRAMNGERMYYLCSNEKTYLPLTATAVGRVRHVESLLLNAKEAYWTPDSYVCRPGESEAELNGYVKELEAAQAKAFAAKGFEFEPHARKMEVVGISR